MNPLANLFPPSLLSSRRTRAAIVVALILFVLWLLFDWNWFRPALIDYVSEKSHRTISVSDLDVDFSWSLQPTIKLRDLHIENASWAKNQGAKPLIAVKEITFTFATFRMLFAEKRVISLISMSDGEVNLEKLENGLRNWRRWTLSTQDRANTSSWRCGPGKVPSASTIMGYSSTCWPSPTLPIRRARIHKTHH